MSSRLRMLVGAIATLLVACSSQPESGSVPTARETTAAVNEIHQEACSLAWVASVAQDVFTIESVSKVTRRPNALVTAIDAQPDPSVLESLYHDYETVEVEIRSVEGGRSDIVGESPSIGTLATLVALPSYDLATIKSGMVVLGARRLLDGDLAWFPAAWFESDSGSVGEIASPCGAVVETDIDRLESETGHSRSLATIIEAVSTANEEDGIMNSWYEQTSESS